MVILLLYVDDMIITDSDLKEIHALKLHLRSCFEMKDLGLLRYFLGIEIEKSCDVYFISQVKHASDILQGAGLTDIKTVDTPLELDLILNCYEGHALSNPTMYQHLVGSLNYLTIARPDISHAVHIVSQFMTSPRSTHFAVELRILNYIKGTLYQGLHFSSNLDLRLRGYSDSDWAGDVTDRRSTTGYCLFLGNSLISWRSKKQTVVSRSSAEDEYRALAHTTSEIVWIRCLLQDMGVKLSEPTPLACYNKDPIHIAHNDVFHEHTKHIEIDCHSVRHHFKHLTITLPHVCSELQLADIFTKTLPASRLHILSTKLNMFSAPS
ncbi:uncharacterized protein LOC113329070 [Papaver somniferum]|uniref:uncharacterized protein LOC113329070 n=1 Tax=Papaver somniferum TaxID=3469 RepID=UPI000E701660|nr:uncharacterized protein LOC113329070 [Papaver somniferum]